MDKEIKLGNVVEVCINTKKDAFLGIVIEKNNTKSWKKDNWYRVQPLESGHMPANFWYRENKVEKIAENPQFLAIDGGLNG